VVMAVTMAVGMVVPIMRMLVLLSLLAAAHRTHQSTSSSLTRISSPAVICN
jgi:uncharacterized paraquat-inducible protein A